MECRCTTRNFGAQAGAQFKLLACGAQLVLWCTYKQECCDAQFASFVSTDINYQFTDFTKVGFRIENQPLIILLNTKYIS